MAITVANTANTNTIFYLKDRVNELASAMSNYVVTTNTSGTTGNASITGTFTSSNLFSNSIYTNAITSNTGSFTNLTITTTISVGNLSIFSPNTVQQSNGQYFLNANGSYSLVSITPGAAGSNTQVTFNDSGVSNGTSGFLFNKTSNTLTVANSIVVNSVTLIPFSTNTTGNTINDISTFSGNAYRSAEYLMSIKDNVSTGFITAKILVIQDGTTAYLTEYGTISSNTNFDCFFSARYDNTSNTMTLSAIPTSTNTTIKGHVTYISI